MTNPLGIFRRGHRPDPEKLSAYADGQLAPEAQERLRAHLTGCAACATRLGELTNLRSALAAMPEADVPRSFRLRTADVEQMVRRSPPPSPWVRAMPALSAVALVIFGVALAVDVGRRDDSSGSQVASRIGLADDGGRAESAPDSGGMNYDAGGSPSAAEAPSGGSDSATRSQGLVPAPDAPATDDSGESSEADENFGGVTAPTPTTDEQVSTANDTPDDSGDGSDAWLRAVEFAALALAAGAGAVAFWTWRSRRGASQ